MKHYWNESQNSVTQMHFSSYYHDDTLDYDWLTMPTLDYDWLTMPTTHQKLYLYRNEDFATQMSVEVE